MQLRAGTKRRCSPSSIQRANQLRRFWWRQAFRAQVIGNRNENFWKSSAPFSGSAVDSAPMTHSMRLTRFPRGQSIGFVRMSGDYRQSSAGPRYSRLERANRDASRLRDRARQSSERRTFLDGEAYELPDGRTGFVSSRTCRKPDRSSRPVRVSRRAVVADGLRRGRLTRWAVRNPQALSTGSVRTATMRRVNRSSTITGPHGPHATPGSPQPLASPRAAPLLPSRTTQSRAIAPRQRAASVLLNMSAARPRRSVLRSR